MNCKSERHTSLPGMLSIVRVALAALLALLAALPGSAQFSSGSNGSDGALNLITPGTVIFDPVGLGLDLDGDHVFHFTTINIGAGVTVRLSNQYLNGPVYWLATQEVAINGIIDLNGETGYSCTNTLPNYSLRRPALGGAGGFNGGVGGWSAGPSALSSQPGSGPSGGTAAPGPANGNGLAGTLSANLFLIPMVGGSGGGGAFNTNFACFGGGGGGGGGAIVIASSVSITVTSPGTIQANGGSGGSITFTCCTGGAGAGGAIRLMSNLIAGNGTITASSPAGAAFAGRIRLEANQQSTSFSVSPTAILASPTLLATVLPAGPPPSIRALTVDGVALPAIPGGSFTIPDATIDNSNPVAIAIQASNIPLGTVLTLRISSESGPDLTTTSTPLAGTVANSTASATVTFPSGFSRGYLRATF